MMRQIEFYKICSDAFNVPSCDLAFQVGRGLVPVAVRFSVLE